jgi:hypothetical protein
VFCAFCLLFLIRLISRNRLNQLGPVVARIADYAGTGLTVGKHPVDYRRTALRRNNILSAAERAL